MIIRVLSQRLITAVMMLILVSVFTFLMIHLAPSDPANIIASQQLRRPPTAEEAAYFRELYRLDEPISTQYFNWFTRILQGDLGDSYRTQKPVSQEINQRFGATFILALFTFGFVLLVSIPTGILAALKPDSLVDRTLNSLALLSVSIPDFWLAFLLILIFSIYMHWLPSFGMQSPLHFVMPVITLGLANAARLSRLTRSICIHELRQDYIRTARAKGIKLSRIWNTHIIPNILVPFITYATMQFSSLASGSVILETVFAWPGLGSFYAEAVTFRDIPVIQATVLIFAALFIFLNLLVDMLYPLIDPRIEVN